MKNRYFVFAKGLDFVFKGIIANLIEILREYKKVSIYELMFFVTAIDISKDEFSFAITQTEAIKPIKKFNLLSPTQKNAVIGMVKKELNPRNYSGNKTDKRDFHNWKNESQQIMTLLKETPYFEIRDENIYLSTQKDFSDALAKRLNRSLDAKYLYFQNHKIKAVKGFELHHIVPLSWSESIHHFKLLDKWENMLYIDGFSHAKITQNSNRNVHLTSDNNDFILDDFSDNQVFLKFQDNVIYLIELQTKLLKYNHELLKG
jgi:type II restriction enzyme